MLQAVPWGHQSCDLREGAVPQGNTGNHHSRCGVTSGPTRSSETKPPLVWQTFFFIQLPRSISCDFFPAVLVADACGWILNWRVYLHQCKIPAVNKADVRICLSFLQQPSPLSPFSSLIKTSWQASCFSRRLIAAICPGFGFMQASSSAPINSPVNRIMMKGKRQRNLIVLRAQRAGEGCWQG